MGGWQAVTAVQTGATGGGCPAGPRPQGRDDEHRWGHTFQERAAVCGPGEAGTGSVLARGRASQGAGPLDLGGVTSPAPVSGVEEPSSFQHFPETPPQTCS